MDFKARVPWRNGVKSHASVARKELLREEDAS